LTISKERHVQKKTQIPQPKDSAELEKEDQAV
jgi:hypothetical protein